MDVGNFREVSVGMAKPEVTYWGVGKADVFVNRHLVSRGCGIDAGGYVFGVAEVDKPGRRFARRRMGAGKCAGYGIDEGKSLGEHCSGCMSRS